MQEVCAKVILFGEYALLRGGSALAMPLTAFKGRLSMMDVSESFAIESNQNLYKYTSWIKEQPNLHPYIQLFELEQDLKKGMWFNSSIPFNSGLGSSGAVVAALLRQYGNAVLLDKSLQELKSVLSNFEGYFHGTSSGIDPLISFLGMAVELKSTGEVEALDLNIDQSIGAFHPFLLQIKGKGETHELVDVFNQKWLDKDYVQYFNNTYLPLNNSLVDAFKRAQPQSFWTLLNQLSKSQVCLFPEMIDEELRRLMKKGISTGEFGIKICGSGGGGFALGFAKSQDIISELFPTGIAL